MIEKYQTGESKLVHQFQKNSQEIVRASLKTYRGSSLVDIRVFFPVSSGNPSPTRKGITLSTALLPELARAVAALQKAVERKGAAPGSDMEVFRRSHTKPRLP